MTPLEKIIRQKIEATGAMPLAQFMELALTHPQYGYYMQRNPFGKPTETGGDFTTAPEISQMFGEILGAWICDYASRSAFTEPISLLELGGGRGLLMADMQRIIASQKELNIHPFMLEASPYLRVLQSEKTPRLTHIQKLSNLPPQPLICIANEFFDALPIHQYKNQENSFLELFIHINNNNLKKKYNKSDKIEIAAHYPPEATFEYCPLADDIIATLTHHISEYGGAIMVIDYGYDDYLAGDSLQAMQHHSYVSIFHEIGKSDLTAHVNFKRLADMANKNGGYAHALQTQGDFLSAMGIELRAQNLKKTNPAKADMIDAQLHRLIAPTATNKSNTMGDLFKVLCITAPHNISPAGFGR